MSSMIYQWSRKKSITGAAIIIGVIIAAILIVEFKIVSPESLSYFSDALDIVVLMVFLASTLGITLGYRMSRGR